MTQPLYYPYADAIFKNRALNLIRKTANHHPTLTDTLSIKSEKLPTMTQPLYYPYADGIFRNRALNLIRKSANHHPTLIDMLSIQ